jgi:hypothetical protein
MTETVNFFHSSFLKGTSTARLNGESGSFSLSRPVQIDHFQTDPDWLDGPLKVISII